MDERDIVHHPQMLEDLEWWQANDMQIAQHVVALIEETEVTPEEGRGRPKRLSGLPNTWARRITRDHRLYYTLTPDEVFFVSCRGALSQIHLEALAAGEEL